MLKKIINLIILFIGIVLFGFVSLVITYALPITKIHDNVVNNIGISFPYYQSILKYETTSLDLYTDSVILGEIAYYNKDASLVDNAMSVYSSQGMEDFIKYAAGDESVVVEYARYWHGNLVVLKPLFYLFDYNSIKVLELFFQVIMIIVIVKLMKKNKLDIFIIPFILSLFFIHPEVIGLSFQFQAMFNLLLVSIAVLLKFKDTLFKENRLIYFFLAIGMLTSFFDFLTYPAVIFGVPIIFYFLLEDSKVSMKKKLLNIILYGVLWSVGYIGMWFSKWVIASLVLHRDVIGTAVNTIFFRTSANEFTRLDAIKNNIMVYKERAYALIFAVLFIYYLVRLIKNRKNINTKIVIDIIPLLLIAIIPFAWFFVMSNHSYIHYWMTYRELLIFFFAAFCSLEILINNEGSLVNEKRKKNRSTNTLL